MDAQAGNDEPIAMRTRSQPLQLPRPGIPSRRPVPGRRRRWGRRARWRQAALGLLLLIAGCGLLAALLLLTTKLNALLLVSSAIVNLIRGLQQLGLALLQLLVLLVVVLLALLALLLLVGGAVRLLRAAWPERSRGASPR